MSQKSFLDNKKSRKNFPYVGRGGGVNQHMENSICFVVFIFESFPKLNIDYVLCPPDCPILLPGVLLVVSCCNSYRFPSNHSSRLQIISELWIARISEFSDSNESADKDPDHTNIEDIKDSIPEEESTMFEKLCVSSWILAQLSGLGISKPSPIQRHCIPPLLAWLDGTVWSWPRLVRENICICHSYFTYFVSWPVWYLRGFSDTNKRVCKPDRGQFHESLSGNEPPHHRGHRRSWHHQAESGPPGRLADHIRTNSTFSLSKVKYFGVGWRRGDWLLEG